MVSIPGQQHTAVARVYREIALMSQKVLAGALGEGLANLVVLDYVPQRKCAYPLASNRSLVDLAGRLALCVPLSDLQHVFEKDVPFLDLWRQAQIVTLHGSTGVQFSGTFSGSGLGNPYKS